MADNIPITVGSGRNVATDQVTYSGDTADVQLFKPVFVTGSEGSKTVVDVPGDATYGWDVDVTRVPTDPFGANADAASSSGSISAKLRFIATTGIPQTGTSASAGDVAHDAPDSGNPQKIGFKAIAHGANPTQVAAGDRTDGYANRHGIPFWIGGHPNTITRSVRIADADGAQTDVSIVGTISAGTKVVVTAFSITCDAGNTNALAAKLGFGAATIPADSNTGAAGTLFDHEGIAPGSGVVVGNGAGILGIGADGEELRLTCEDPVGGFLCVTFSYFTIES